MRSSQILSSYFYALLLPCPFLPDTSHKNVRVGAEVLGDLLEHAEELLRSKFYLAAAIVMRAILEERLRKLCGCNACQPTVNRPTIEHFKQSLYAANVIDKIVAKDIDWMASIGNAAAHQLLEYKDADVPHLYTRLTAFSP